MDVNRRQERRILHIDMDAFFASVEQRDNPELRGKPIAVGGDGRRGVVAAASYEARKFGVHSAMPGSRAIRLCPDLIFVPHRFDAYRKASSEIRSIFKSVTPMVEPLSLDEAYLDISQPGLTWESARHIAGDIKNRIFQETSLTASAGVSFNKFLAKMASGENKPDGLTLIIPEEAQAYMDALPIGKFYGVGRVTAARMQDRGIATGRDLRSRPLIELARQYGKMGRYLYQVVRGIDDREVQPHRERKSVSVERTYSIDLTTLSEVRDAFETLAELLRIRIEKADASGRTLVIKVRFHGFETHTRQKKLNVDSSTDIKVLVEAAFDLLKTLKPLRPIRLLGIGIADLITDEGGPRQLTLDIG